MGPGLQQMFAFCAKHVPSARESPYMHSGPPRRRYAMDAIFHDDTFGRIDAETFFSSQRNRTVHERTSGLA